MQVPARTLDRPAGQAALNRHPHGSIAASRVSLPATCRTFSYPVDQSTARPYQDSPVRRVLEAVFRDLQCAVV